MTTASGTPANRGTSSPRGGVTSWIDDRLATAVRLPALYALALVGLVALLAPVALPVALHLRHSTPGPDRYHLWFALLVTLVPCGALSARWVSGRTRWAAGAAALIPSALSLAALLVGGALPGSGHGVVWLSIPLLPCGLLGTRWVAVVTRRLVARWCGVTIAAPYRPAPGDEASGGTPDPLRRLRRLRRWTGWLLTDPATWRDLLWTAVTGCALCLAATPIVLMLYGSRRFLRLPGGLRVPGPSGPGPNVHTIARGLITLAAEPVSVGGLTAVFTGLGTVALGLLFGPRLLSAYGGFARSLLGPTGQAELALRVRHLAQTRSDTLEGGAAEMRRIERDLHDGAQARLVAMGMALSAAEDLVDSSPDAAKALLAEARASSAKALAELRALVRGIHPPVLADRGLADAVHALALDLPLRVHFSSDLAGRPPAPVESAAYFTVSELLTNISKHAAATRAWIEIGHTGDMLRVRVSDDGRGGADPAGGTGLRGLERRLAAFDGVLAVSSPLGGPTLVNLEIPCALSSPKTSFC